MRKLITSFFILMGCTMVCYGQEQSMENKILFEIIENYIYSPIQDRKTSKEYYSKVKALADKDNPEAHYYLGLLQKDGLGIKQSFRKSRKSFKRAYDLGNTKAAYSLGYYFLKGIGDIEQDYIKAYRWFKKSDYPMAKHWMAKMHFMGLGRKCNKEKAISILETNELYNSKVLLEQYTKNDPPRAVSSKLFSDFIGKNTIKELYGLNNFHRTPHATIFEGEWEGEYFQLDWSKNKILRFLPFELEFSRKDELNGQFEVRLSISDSTSTTNAGYSAGMLSFEELKIPVKKQYTDYPNFTHLITDISSLEIREIQTSDGSLLVAKMNANYPLWQEKTNPGLLIFKKKSLLSKEALMAFEEQANDFVRLYPNPFSSYLLLNFDLSEDSDVRITLSNYYNTPAYQRIVFEGHKLKGNHTFEINKLPTRSGSYLISIEFNGFVENKIVVKN
ncbi:MAG: hypothetical protein AAF849_00760 [Bacteroidota bacterium]